MDNFTIIDENGKESVADIITVFSYHNNDYIVYSIEEDDENVNVLVSKLKRDNEGNDYIIDIEDDTEREGIKKIVEELIDSLETA